MKIKFKRFSARARCPQHSTDGFAGYDLFSAENIVLEPYSMQCIETDIGLCFSKRFFAKFYSRSGISSCSTETGAGVIDQDFRGNVKVVLYNLSDRQVEFQTGDRIAQVAFQKVQCQPFSEVSDFNNSVTERSKQGFGSTEVRQRK